MVVTVQLYHGSSILSIWKTHECKGKQMPHLNNISSSATSKMENMLVKTRQDLMHAVIVLITVRALQSVLPWDLAWNVTQRL